MQALSGLLHKFQDPKFQLTLGMRLSAFTCIYTVVYFINKQLKSIC